MSLNRLIDMVVEEVSLVDLAANKRRFLVVKRNDPMSGITKNDAAVAMDAAAAASAQGATTDTAQVPDTAKAAPEGGAVLESAVSALEVLTSLVESLSELGQSEEANQKLAALAGSLVEIGQAILSAAGGTPATETPEAPAPASDETMKAAEAALTVEAEKAAKFESTLSQAQALVAKLSAAVTATNMQTPAAELAKSQATITASIAKFNAALADVHTRVSKVEKQFGVPSSSPTETPAQPAASTVVWPTDLNSSGGAK